MGSEFFLLWLVLARLDFTYFFELFLDWMGNSISIVFLWKLYKCHPIVSGLHSKILSFLSSFVCNLTLAPLDIFFSSALAFNSLKMMHLGVVFFTGPWLAISGTSCICGFIVSSNLKLLLLILPSNIFFSNIFSVLSLLSSDRSTISASCTSLIAHVLYYLILHFESLMLCSFVSGSFSICISFCVVPIVVYEFTGDFFCIAQLPVNPNQW